MNKRNIDAAAIMAAATMAIMITNAVHDDFVDHQKFRPVKYETTHEVKLYSFSCPLPESLAEVIIEDDEENDDENDDEHHVNIDELTKIRCTCYIPTGNPTASGVMPYEGICASNREHMGWTARIYTIEGEYIGDFISLDTGGHETLQNGTSIDIFRDNMDRAWDWIHTYGDYVLIEWIEPEE